jgi:regulator of sigma E protease
VDLFLNDFSAFGLGRAVVSFLFVLTIVVFFHELGHFLVARWCGVKVLTFSIGFGPELFGFNDRKGTRWKLSAVPLGGYVKFFGDESEASTPSPETLAAMSADDRKISFHHKSVPARAAIVAAGPVANFILAIVIFFALAITFGRPSDPARVDGVKEGSVAAAAGFKAGDIIASIDGKAITSFVDLQRTVSINAGQKLVFGVRRDGTTLELAATPELQEIKDNFGNKHRIGILGIEHKGKGTREPIGFFGALESGVSQTWFVIDRTLVYIGKVIVGRESADQIGGPIRIAQISGQVASVSLPDLINLAAVLSVSIGLLNLFPVPLLDGGHLLFYLVEAVRGRPLSDRAQEMGFRVGLALVLMLMIFATYNDILHVFLRTS